MVHYLSLGEQAVLVSFSFFSFLPLLKFGFSFFAGKNLKTRFKKKKKATSSFLTENQATVCYGLVILCSGLGNAPPIQLQAPIQSPTGTTIAWRFPQVDGSSPPDWLDQGRASELSCGRGTERVLDLYPLHL